MQDPRPLITIITLRVKCYLKNIRVILLPNDHLKLFFYCVEKFYNVVYNYIRTYTYLKYSINVYNNKNYNNSNNNNNNDNNNNTINNINGKMR